MERNSRSTEREQRGRGRDDDSRESRGGRDRGRDRDDDRPARRNRDEEDDRGGRSGGRRGGSGFQYRQRDAAAAQRRSESNGRDFDSFISDEVKLYKMRDDNSLRILPPTWDDAEHWGLDIHVHFQVGPDEGSYLCLHKMKNEQCPICDERRKALKDGDEEYAKALEPTKRTLMYVIDRNDEKAGLFAWSAPMSVDRDILKVSLDKRSRELLPIDNPDEGYDVNFERTGKGKNTKYVGLSIARRSSPLDNDEALEFAVEHPLPTILKFYDYDYIEKVFNGGGPRSGSADRGDARGSSADRRERDRGSHDHSGSDADARRGTSRGHESRDADEPTWESVQELDYDGLCDLIDAQRLDIQPDKSKDDQDLRDWVCEELKLEEPKRGRDTASDSGADEANSRLGRMRRSREG